MALSTQLTQLLSNQQYSSDSSQDSPTFSQERLSPQLDIESVDAFKSYFSSVGDFSPSDRFNVLIDVPFPLASSLGINGRDLIFQCDSAELPGKTVDVLAVRHNMFVDRVPLDVVYPEITLTFLCRSDLLEKKLFDAWMESMINTQTDDWRYGLVKYKRQEKSVNRYDTTITIFQKFPIQTQVHASAIQLIDAMPISVSSLGLSWADHSFHRLAVTFGYRKWKDLTIRFGSPIPFPALNDDDFDYLDPIAGSSADSPNSSQNQIIEKEIIDVVRWEDALGAAIPVYQPQQQQNSGSGVTNNPIVEAGGIQA